MSNEPFLGHTETDRITCPYCDYEFTNSWEYFHKDFENDGDEDVIVCDECNKEFRVNLHIYYTYDSGIL